MGGEGTSVFRAVKPRRWTAVVAALLVVLAVAVQWPLARSRCVGGTLRSWGPCNECGELTRHRVKYGMDPRTREARTFRFFCETCEREAPGKIRVRKSEHEDWSVAYRLGIHTALLLVMALGIVFVRWAIPWQVPLWWETAALLVGPIHMAATIALVPGSWVPLVVAGAAWASTLAGLGGGTAGVPPARPGAPPMGTPLS